MSRRRTSIRRTLLITISGMAALIALLVADGAWRARQRLSKVETLRDAWLVSDGLFSTAEQLSVERGIALSMLNAPADETVAHLRLGLEAARNAADVSLRESLDILKQSQLPDLQHLIARTEAHRSTLRSLRLAIDADAGLTNAERDTALSARWFREVTALIRDRQDLGMGLNRHVATVDATGALHTRFKYMLGTLDDHIGREQAAIGRSIVERTPITEEEQAALLQWHGTILLSWRLAETLAVDDGMSPALAPDLKDAKSHYDTVYDMVRDVVHYPGPSAHSPPPIDIKFWLELSAQANESLQALRAAALVASSDHLEMLEAEAEREILVRAAILVFALALCASSLRVVSDRVLGPIQGMVEALLRATRGEFSAPEATGAREVDEIDKLARVLEVFQRKSEEVERSSHALERHAVALEHSNKELDDFAYIASHDLKEPLRGIHNHSRFLLEDNEDKLDPDSVKRLTRLVHLSQRMEHLINDLLYFSRIGRQDLAIRATDLNEIIRDIELTLEVFLEERRARIVVPRPLPTIICDKTRVTELFRNLITNGVKYNDAPEKIVEIEFVPERPLPDGSLRRQVFSVSDNGRGIAPQFHDAVFRIFKRLQASKEGEEEGTGVGLTFVRKIVERHGGTIWIESELGKGSAFYFTLQGEPDDELTATAG